VSDVGQLLALQQLDTVLTQLHHRRGHLPEHTERSEAQQAIIAEHGRSAADRTAAAELAAKMADIEHQVHEYDARIEQLTSQMYSDAARSPRDLQAIETDIASIKLKRSELEDTELELIEAFEPIDQRVRASDATIAAHTTRIAALDEAILVAQQGIDIEAAANMERRKSLAATIEPSLIEQYERIRSNNKGIGAAALEHGTCMSCKLKLPAVELDRIRQLPSDALIRCDECGAILVRS
jgi:uncharacterized protein